jgi:hypothetical protein
MSVSVKVFLFHSAVMVADVLRQQFYFLHNLFKDGLPFSKGRSRGADVFVIFEVLLAHFCVWRRIFAVDSFVSPYRVFCDMCAHLGAYNYSCSAALVIVAKPAGGEKIGLFLAVPSCTDA